MEVEKMEVEIGLIDAGMAELAAVAGRGMRRPLEVRAIIGPH
jgi:hypothetical protein